MELQPASFYTIRFSDCDLFAHLNNARYIDYFLNAREDHLKNSYQLQLNEYYKLGVAWLVGNHEIYYLRPANYNEVVRIQSTLLKVADDYLLVEMMMTNETGTHLKALLWTKFIPIHVQSGKRQNHPELFMDFARKIENSNITTAANSKGRLEELIAGFKANLVKQ
jgi:YbgC/YbaW family acyl-CoA thioester hydrolase